MFWKYQPISKGNWNWLKPRPISFFYLTNHLFPSSTILKIEDIFSKKDEINITMFHKKIEEKNIPSIYFQIEIYNNEEFIGKISYYPTNVFFFKKNKSQKKIIKQSSYIVEDLFIDEKYRKKKLASFLISCIIQKMQIEKIPYSFFFHDGNQYSIPYEPFQHNYLYVYNHEKHIENQNNIFKNTSYIFIKKTFSEKEIVSLALKQFTFFHLPIFINPNYLFFYIYEIFGKHKNIRLKCVFYGTYFEEDQIFTIHGFFGNLKNNITIILQCLHSNNIQKIKKIIHLFPNIPTFYNFFKEPWEKTQESRKIFAYNMHYNNILSNQSFISSWKD